MQKNIPFSYGIHRSPSIGNDGELSECVNLLPKNGELVNIHPPQPIGITLEEGDTLLYVHRVSGKTNYITLDGSENRQGLIAYYNNEEEGKQSIQEELTGNESVFSVNSIGNTLVVLCSDGIHYYLHKENTYKALGSHVPDLGLVFGLEAQTMSRDTNENISIDNYGDKIYRLGTIELYDNGNTQMIEKVFALLNPILEDHREAGYFFNPFFVRYAYRTHGGSYMYVSNPVLMVPNSGTFPYIEAVEGFKINIPGLGIDTTTKEEGFKSYLQDGVLLKGANKIRFKFNSCKLCYKITNQQALTNLEDWSDIIQYIDIFVTNPSNSRLKNDGTCHIYINEDSYGPLYQPFGGYVKGLTKDVFGYIDSYDFTNADLITLPQMDNKEYEELMESEGVFRLAESITLDNLKNKYVYDNGFIMAEVGSLNNINSRETLDTEYDYHSRDSIVAKYAFEYNSRLNITGIDRYPYCPTANMMFTFTDGYLDTEGESVQKTYDVSVYAILSESGKRIKLNSASTPLYDMPSWVFFPSTKITQLIFERKDPDTGTYDYAVLPMKQHASLNGSYYMKKENSETYSYNPFEKEQIAFTSERPAVLDEEYDNFVPESNKIYTSEADNPFVFPLSGINTIGTGDINGICSATKALSQGQFGQFPLYVFSTDGIWAMEVNPDTGLYSSVHPVSRDVCSNVKSIAQIDNAIVFATEQGLKLLQGSEVSLISRAMEGFHLSKSKYNILQGYEDLFVEDEGQFIDVLRGCQIIYDYPNALLHIYPQEGGKHYIYSFESGEYSSFVGHELVTSVPGYPESVLQIGNSLFSYKNINSEVMQKGFLITRPLSFDDPLAMKMLEDIRMTSYRSSHESKIRYAVFVSNDNRLWSQMLSLRSRSYKYFRFVIFTYMYDTDALSGISVQFNYTRTGKMR